MQLVDLYLTYSYHTIVFLLNYSRFYRAKLQILKLLDPHTCIEHLIQYNIEQPHFS